MTAGQSVTATTARRGIVRDHKIPWTVTPRESQRTCRRGERTSTTTANTTRGTAAAWLSTGTGGSMTSALATSAAVGTSKAQATLVTGSGESTTAPLKRRDRARISRLTAPIFLDASKELTDR